MAASSPDLATLKAQYDAHGYVILPGILDAASLLALRAAAARATALTRSGAWTRRRVVGKSFPPYDPALSDDSWGVQHLLHPELDEGQRFADFYANARLLEVAAALLGTTQEAMQMELFNLLINPASHAFALQWHRDDIRPALSAAEESARLAAPCSGVQWNAALYDDECLFIVPGTHRTRLNEAERRANEALAPEARKVEEGETGLDGRWEVDPPSTLQVKLKAGEVVFYSQRILHRASYLPSRKRATLHGCYGGVISAPTSASAAGPADDEAQQEAMKERARNVLQHGVEWMREPSFGAGLPPRLQPMWKNLLAMDERARGLQLGYSLEG